MEVEATPRRSSRRRQLPRRMTEDMASAAEWDAAIAAGAVDSGGDGSNGGNGGHAVATDGCKRKTVMDSEDAAPAASAASDQSDAQKDDASAVSNVGEQSVVSAGKDGDRPAAAPSKRVRKTPAAEIADAPAASPSTSSAPPTKKRALQSAQSATTSSMRAAGMPPPPELEPSQALFIQELMEGIFSFLVLPVGLYKRGKHTYQYTPAAAAHTLVLCSRVCKVWHSILTDSIRLWRELAESSFHIRLGQLVPLEDGMQMMRSVQCQPLRCELNASGTHVDIGRHLMLSALRHNFCLGCGQWAGLELTRKLFSDPANPKNTRLFCHLCRPVTDTRITHHHPTWVSYHTACGPPYLIPQKYLYLIPRTLKHIEEKALELAWAQQQPEMDLGEIDKLSASAPHVEPRLALIVEYYFQRVVGNNPDADIQAICIGPDGAADGDGEEENGAKGMKRRRKKTGQKLHKSIDGATAETEDIDHEVDTDDRDLLEAAKYLHDAGQWSALLKSTVDGMPDEPLGADFRRKVVQMFNEADEVRKDEEQFIEAWAAVGLTEDRLADAPFEAQLSFLRRRAQIRSSRITCMRGPLSAWVESIFGRHAAHVLLTSSFEEINNHDGMNYIFFFLCSNMTEIEAEIEAEREYKRQRKEQLKPQQVRGGDEAADDEDGAAGGGKGGGGLQRPETPMRARMSRLAESWNESANKREERKTLRFTMSKLMRNPTLGLKTWTLACPNRLLL